MKSSALRHVRRYWPVLVNAGSLLLAVSLAPLLWPGARLPAEGVLLALVVVISCRTVAPEPSAGLWRQAGLLLPGQVSAGLACLVAGRLVWNWAWPVHAFFPLWLGLTALTWLRLLPPRHVAAALAWLRWLCTFLTRRLRQALEAGLARGDDTALSASLLIAGVAILAGRLNPQLHLGVGAALACAALWLLVDRLPYRRWQSAPDSASRRKRYFGRLVLWMLLFGTLGLGFGAGPLQARLAVLLLMSAALIGFGLTHWHSMVGAGENAARTSLGLLAVALAQPFASDQLLGSQDAVWYHNTLADFLQQVRAGVFPVFVGQSEHLFNGGVLPVRFAPLFQHYGLLLDLLTLRSLTPASVQQGVIIASLLGAAVTSYGVLSLLLPGKPWRVAGLSTLFLTCPGVLAVIYYEDLFMTWTTLPWLPLVFGGCALSLRSSSPWPLLLSSCSLGLVWWGHAPVAMWSTLAVAAIQLGRLVATPFRDWPWRQLLAAAIGFLAISLYPLLSVLAVPVQTDVASLAYTPTDPGAITHFIHQCFPHILVPLFLKTRSLSDFQPGWPLLLILAACVTVLVRQRNRDLRWWSLLAVPLGLLLLVVPMPWLTGAIWSVVPDFLVNPTGTWPMQRFYVIIAITTVCLAAVLDGRSSSSRSPRWIPYAMAVAVIWSFQSAIPLLRSKNLQRREVVLAADRTRLENFVLTRYAYLVFGRQPAYYTHGHMDALYEQRFLSAENQQWVGGNPNAILQDPAVGRVLMEGPLQAAIRKSGEPWQIAPSFRLEPGKRYALDVRFAHPETPGVLLLNGSGFSRVYALPSYGEKFSFGSGPEASSLLSLFTTSSQPVEVRLGFAPQSGSPPADLSRFGTYRWLEVDTAKLPIRITGWIPYSAEVNSPAAGWLETPRMFQPGYQASVNGSPVAVSRSAEGLAAVPVPAGRSLVVLAYHPPFLLRAGYACSVAGILICAVILLRAASRPHPRQA